MTVRTRAADETGTLMTATASLTAAGPAMAFRGMPPSYRVDVRDQARCDALAKQFAYVQAHRLAGDAAKDQASEGEALCRASLYGEDADTLEKPVR